MAAAAAPTPVAITVSPAFQTLVKLLAGMFYAGQCPPPWWVDAADPKKDAPDPEHAMFQPEKKAAQLNREAKRKAQQDTTGLGVILLNSLTEVQWVEEDEFARSLNLPPKMVRKAMRFLEQEQLVQREHRRESVRHRKQERTLMIQAGMRQGPGGSKAAAGSGAAAAGLEPAEEEEEEEAIAASKGHVITYCALDYPRIVDSVRLRLANMRASLKKEISSDDAMQRYKCSHPHCGKQFTSMDVWELVPCAPGGMASKGKDAGFTCSICGSEVALVLDEGGKELGSVEDKRERQQKAKAMRAAMDAALAPLVGQLQAIAEIKPPDLLSYRAWLQNEAGVKQRLNAAAQAGAGAGSSRRPGAAPVFDLNTQVVINFGDSSGANESARQLAGAAPSSLAGAAAAASQGASAGMASRAAAGASGPAGSNWLSQQTAAPQQQASKPIPPWLISAHKKSLEAAGMSSMQQLGAASGLGLGGGIKPDTDGFSMKPDPGVKMEGLKPDPDLLLKQEAEADDDEMWEDVEAGGDEGVGIAGGAGSSQGGSAAAGLDDIGDEEWEDV